MQRYAASLWAEQTGGWRLFHSAMHPTLSKPTLKSLTIRVFRSIQDCREHWTSAAPKDNIFLQPEYLATLEECPPYGMSFRYAILEQHGIPFGVVYTQILYFQGGESFRIQAKEGAHRCLFDLFGQYIRSLVARQVAFSTLVCGNLMLSGEHGFHLGEGNAGAGHILEKAIRTIRDSLHKEGTPVSVILLKDFEDQAPQLYKRLAPLGYHPFHILPSMVMALAPEWTSFEDYLEALSSKYRVRAKKARKIMQGRIQKRRLVPHDLERFSERMHLLYQQVVDDSGFNVIHLQPGYFTRLARNLGEDVILTGYFEQEKLIGFTSAIRNGNGELEAHFLGYDREMNPGLKLYLNMLLDLTETGILQKCNRIILARTAEEIKSSIGAVPVPLLLFIRHRSHFANRFIKPLLDYLNPEEEIILRHPFRQDS